MYYKYLKYKTKYFNLKGGKQFRFTLNGDVIIDTPEIIDGQK